MDFKINYTLLAVNNYLLFKYVMQIKAVLHD